LYQKYWDITRRSDQPGQNPAQAEARYLQEMQSLFRAAENDPVWTKTFERFFEIDGFEHIDEVHLPFKSVWPGFISRHSPKLEDFEIPNRDLTLLDQPFNDLIANWRHIKPDPTLFVIFSLRRGDYWDLVAFY